MKTAEQIIDTFTDHCHPDTAVDVFNELTVSQFILAEQQGKRLTEETATTIRSIAQLLLDIQKTMKTAIKT